MSDKTVLVLGGGVGGIVAARRLRRLLLRVAEPRYCGASLGSVPWLGTLEVPTGDRGVEVVTYRARIAVPHQAYDDDFGNSAMYPASMCSTRKPPCCSSAGISRVKYKPWNSE
jgi:flavin-dependent dehydrogenase